MKRDREKEEDLRGLVEGAKLDSSSLSVQRIGRTDRWQVIVEGEVIDELSYREHPRLIAYLMVIGEEHRAALELAYRKLAQMDKALAGARKGGAVTHGKSKSARITELARAALERGEDAMQYVEPWASRHSVTKSTAYKAIAKARKGTK